VQDIDLFWLMLLLLFLSLSRLISECDRKLVCVCFLQHSFIIHYIAVILLYIVQVTDSIVK